MYEQRRGATAEEFEARAPWEPSLEDIAAAPPRPWAEGMYLVVDERYDDAVRVTLDPWPSLDRRGRLRFHGRTRTEVVDLVAWREFVAATTDDPPTRVRIGNSYAVWREDLDLRTAVFPRRLLALGEPEIVAELALVDITRAARRMAKAATLAAATRPLDPLQVRRLRMDEPPPQAPPTDPFAHRGATS